MFAGELLKGLESERYPVYHNRVLRTLVCLESPCISGVSMTVVSHSVYGCTIFRNVVRLLPWGAWGGDRTAGVGISYTLRL